jgi:DNA-binding XRE family transcriptional regulator
MRKSKPLKRRKTAWETVIAKNRETIVDMYSRGATKEKLATFLGISQPTFFAAEREHPDFAEQLVKARMRALDEVKGAMFKRAVGYTAERMSIRKIDGKEVKFVERYEIPADVHAASMILKNAGEWSDNPVVDEAVAGALKTDDERRAEVCRILGIPDPGYDRSTPADALPEQEGCDA